jgi:hypothetical protein
MDVSPRTEKVMALDDAQGDSVRESRDARLSNVTAAISHETSDEHDREPNRDTSRRDFTELAQSSVRFNVSQPFVERTESRESAPPPTLPSRPAVTLVHGTATVFSPTALLQPLAQTPSEAPVTVSPAPDTAERIVQSIKLQVQRGGGDAIVHLQPEHLGPVSIALRVENGAVSAVITAEQPGVVEWLQTNQQSLRDGLQASGLHLERLVVQRDGQSPSDRHRREWAESQRRESRRRSPQTNSTFEISV